MANDVAVRADPATTTHWPAGVLLLLLGLAVAVAVVARTHHATTHRPVEAEAADGMSALLGLLAAAALAVLGAGLLSTGDLTIHGWGPFAAAGLAVLTPPVLGLLLTRRRATGPTESARSRRDGGR